MALLTNLLSQPFLLRALIVGILVALCAALLGVSLVLKRFSMIGDGLSHVGFGAISFALVMNLSPLYVAVPVMILAAFFLLHISQNGRIKADAAIAMLSSGSIAIGLVVISLAKGSSADIDSYMFGSILSTTQQDMILSIVLSVVVLCLFVLLYNRLFSVTFDENSATASGVRVKRYNVLLSVLTAITIVVGMRLMGTLLISGLIIFPALSSMRLFRHYRSVVISSAVLSVFCFVLGFGMSYWFSTPVGASVILMNLVVFIFSCVVSFGVRRCGK